MMREGVTGREPPVRPRARDAGRPALTPGRCPAATDTARTWVDNAGQLVAGPRRAGSYGMAGARSGLHLLSGSSEATLPSH